MRKDSKIRHIDELRDVLNSVNQEVDYHDLLNNIDIDVNQVRHLCFWDPDNYSKINLDSNDNYKLKLMCWEKGQSSPEESGNVNEWIYVVEGKLLIELSAGDQIKLKRKKQKSQLLPAKALYHINELTGRYIVGNANQKRTITIHIYVNL